jgi:hypothetical protein
MTVAGDERTPLLNGLTPSSRQQAGDTESDHAGAKKNPDDPANLSKAKVATILAANWVRRFTFLIHQALYLMLVY